MFEITHDEFDSSLVTIKLDKTDLPSIESLIEFLRKRAGFITALQEIEDRIVQKEIDDLTKGTQ